MSGRLGELLVRENLISLQQLQKAQDEQRKTGGRIGSLLVKQGAIEEDELTNFLSKQYGVPAINLKDFDIDEEVLKLIPKETAEKHQVIPVNRAGSSLIVAMSDPSNIFAIDDIKFLTGYNVEVVVASEQAIHEAIERYYAEKGPDLDEVMQGFDDSEVAVVETDADDMNAVDLEKSAEDAPVVKLVNLILLDAIKKGASDIHVEPYEKDFRVRFRIDGVLYEVMKPPMKLRNAIISRLKIMAELDISERRLPQDGRIKLKLGKGKEMDFRVSVCPTLFGEKVVMRLLDKSNLQLDMTKLGFEEEQLKEFMEAIDRPYGMVLVTGPTGSGKTTTLYSALSKLNEVAWNISTAEDPVEFNFFGINQVPDARGHRPQLRGRPAQLPAAGPRHHHGRRDPRLRDRGDRGQGGAHRPPRALDAAHQRRPRHGLPPPQHGHRAVPRHRVAQRHRRAAALPQALPGVQEAGGGRGPGAARRGLRRRGDRHVPGRSSRAAARPATTAATRAASPSTR